MGPPGPPGVCSCNLTTFLNSLSLQDAIPGPPGVPGIDGKAGPPGTSVSQRLLVYVSCATHIKSTLISVCILCYKQVNTYKCMYSVLQTSQHL